MSFAPVGSLGTANAKSALGSFQKITLSINPSRDVAVGQIIVVWFATDSVHDPANPGSTDLYGRMACHDSQGNHYSTVVAHHQGASGTSAMGGIFVARVARALDTSDTITTTTVGGTTEGARAMSVEEFDCDPDLRWAVCESNSKTTQSITAADPSSIAISNLDSSREHLFLHYLSAEGPETDAYTWDADYTQITGDGTTGGSDTSNIHIRGGYRIATITTDTVDVTSDTANRDYSQGLCAITEVNYDPEFPTEPVLDDFNRADESPLSRDGDWDTNDSHGPSDASADYLRGVSNVAASVGSNGGSWYIDEVFDEPDGEVFATIVTPGGNRGGAQITFNGGGAAEASTKTGLLTEWRMEDTVNGRWVSDYIELGGALKAHVDCAGGESFGMQRRYPQTHLWVDTGGGWEWVAALHASAGAATGFQNGGKLGMGAIDSTIRLDDFGGGPLSATDTYRRIQ